MDGLKKKVQKRIILGSIFEVKDYSQVEFSSLKIGFSTCPLLQPKWYMPVAVLDHAMRVCLHLMLQIVNPSLKL